MSFDSAAATADGFSLRPVIYDRKEQDKLMKSVIDAIEAEILVLQSVVPPLVSMEPWAIWRRALA